MTNNINDLEQQLENYFNAEDYLNALDICEQMLQVNITDSITWRKKGFALFDMGRYEEALESYNRAFQLDPNDHKIWYNKIIILLNMGRYEEALEFSNCVIQLDPNDFGTWLNKGIVLSNMGRYEEALESCNRAIELNSNEHSTWYNKGVVLLRMKNDEEALESFNRAIHIKSDYLSAWNNRSLLLLNMGRYEEALESYNRAIELDPNNFGTWSDKSLVLLNMERYEEALESYNRAIELNRNDSGVWHNKGVVLVRIKNYEEALESCNRALELNSNNFSTWNNKGIVLKNMKNYEEALESYNRALELNDNNFDTWDDKGFVLLEIQKYEESLESLNRAIELNSNNFSTWNKKGFVLKNMGRYEEALESYNQAIELNDNNFSAWDDKGFVLEKMNNYEEALESLNRAIELNPSNFYTWDNKGIVLRKMGRYEEALESYNRSLELNPNYFNTWNNKGVLLNRMGRYEEALESYKQTVHIKPDYLIGWSNKGVLLKNMGRYEEALEAYNQAIKLNPNDFNTWCYKGILECDFLQRYPEALLSFNQAIKIDVNKSDAWFRHNKGVALRNMGLLKEALLSFEEAIEINPNNSSSWSQKIRLIHFLQGYIQAQQCFDEALTHIKEDKDAEGWAKLHEAMGTVNYNESKKLLWNSSYSKSLSYLRKARSAYELALTKLKDSDYLQALKPLIRILYELKETDKAEYLIREGSDELRKLLNDKRSSDYQKQQLALKFAGFNQLTVDLFIKDNNLTEALETAEKDKNACLSWFFDSKALNIEDIESPDFQQIQRLLKPHTAIIYWHLSPVALSTFVLEEGYSEPKTLQIGVSNKEFAKFNQWCEKWENSYQEYRKTPPENREQALWRKNLPQMLEELKEILKIDLICQEYLSSTTKELILIPHRTLHLYPLHYLFGDKFTCSYLPSGKSGLLSSSHTPFHVKTNHQFLGLETNAKDLSFGTLEISEIADYYNNPQQLKLHKDIFSLDFINTVLSESEGVLHYTGHGEHNFFQPRYSALIIDREIIEKKKYQLTASELYHNVDFLSNYDLTTLSACEVGCANAETITAEFVGITSVLLSKGVKSVISPLWRVREDFTALLMMELHRRIREEKENPHVALDNAIKYLKNMTRDEYIETPVYKYWLTNNLKTIYQETLNYPEFEEISEDLATKLEELEGEYDVSFYLADLADNLETIWEQAYTIKRQSNNDEVKSKAQELEDKISESINYLKKLDNDDKLFDDPYYLASFIYQGMVD